MFFRQNITIILGAYLAPDYTRDKVNFLWEGMVGVDVTAYYLLENSLKTVGNSLDHVYSTLMAISKRFWSLVSLA